MNRLIKLLQRALASYAMRCLEIQLHDQTTALQHVADIDAYSAIYRARSITQRDLLKARQHYIDLLPPGERRTWSVA